MTTTVQGMEELMECAVELCGVSRKFGKRGAQVSALREVDLRIERGSFTVIMGPSGSGKSTLLHCASGLDRPTSGTVRLGGTELAGMSETKLTKLRRRQVGFVFQSYNLVSALTVTENVLLPSRLAGVRVRRSRVAEVLAQVGLEGQRKRRPAQLSGGQQQRVAIARALVTAPDVLFCDEPTGALDSVTAAEVLGLLRSAVSIARETVVMVTHDPVAASYADRILILGDGLIVADLPPSSPGVIAERLAGAGRHRMQAARS